MRLISQQTNKSLLHRSIEDADCNIRIGPGRSGSTPVNRVRGYLPNPFALDSTSPVTASISLEPWVTRPFIRVASRLEHGKAPAWAYHHQMKRDLPVTCCTECGGAGHNIRVANLRCCKISGQLRCNGINAIAINPLDWTECTHCQATGYYRNKECPNCKGAGYLFMGLMDKATV